MQISSFVSALLCLVCILLLVLAGTSEDSAVRLEFGEYCDHTVDLEVKRQHLSLVVCHGAHASAAEIQLVSDSVASSLPVSPTVTSRLAFDIRVVGVYRIVFADGVSFVLLHTSMYIPIVVLAAYYLYCRKRLSGDDRHESGTHHRPRG